MNDLNVICLTARLVKDSELSFTSSGTAVCKFSIANNQSKKQGDNWVDEAHFFDVVLWSKMGESLSKYLLKGKQIALEGRLVQDRWEAEGKQHSRVKIIASAIQLLGGGKKEEVREPGMDNEPAPQGLPGSDDIPF